MLCVIEQFPPVGSLSFLIWGMGQVPDHPLGLGGEGMRQDSLVAVVQGCEGQLVVTLLQVILLPHPNLTWYPHSLPGSVMFPLTPGPLLLLKSPGGPTLRLAGENSTWW
jgi:hypothetical protein